MQVGRPQQEKSTTTRHAPSALLDIFGLDSEGGSYCKWGTRDKRRAQLQDMLPTTLLIIFEADNKWKSNCQRGTRDKRRAQLQDMLPTVLSW